MAGANQVPHSLQLVLCSCAALSADNPARDLLRRFRSIECRFVRGKPQLTENDPERFVANDGYIVIPTAFTHNVLGRDARAVGGGWSMGTAVLQFLLNATAAVVSQTVGVNAEQIEPLAAGLVEFGKIAATSCCPGYGWVDGTREDVVAEAFESFSEVEHWFYGNLFGAEIAGQVDPRFFSEMPAARVERLEGGAVLVVSSPTYRDWLKEPPPGMAAHLRKFAPHVRIFRP